MKKKPADTRPLLTISFGERHPARITRVDHLFWEQYVMELLDKTVTLDKASRGWSIPAEFKPAYRDGDNLVSRSCLTYDIDQIQRAHVARIQDWLAPYTSLLYTTASHMPNAPRLRAILPTDRPMSPIEFCAVSRRFGSRVGIGSLARESHVPAQMMYLPTTPVADRFRALQTDGPWLSVDEILAEYADWTDRASWPSAVGDTPGSGLKGEDPRGKPGVIGAFCRAYDIEAAIAEFKLPYERVQ